MKNMKVNDPKLWRDSLPEPKPEDNKYTRGHVLINGGDKDSTGATKLAAFAAARAGAGYVSVACDDEALPIYAASFMSIVAKPIKAATKFFQYIDERNVGGVLLGPGNGIGNDISSKVIRCLDDKALKTVLDADAISAFEKDKKTLLSKTHSNCILTPHEGEFKRIFELTNLREKSVEAAAKLANCVIVLKGHDTVIASPDGRLVINNTGPATLATAGTGDVLAGIIVSLFVQGMPAFEAACAGVWMHSEAANKLGRGLIADDLPGAIPAIIQSL